MKPSETISGGALRNGVVFDNSEILALSQSLSYIYIEIIEKLSFEEGLKIINFFIYRHIKILAHLFQRDSFFLSYLYLYYFE